jgi:mevalonate kinase
MMNDGKEFFKTLVLVLKDSSQENRKDELDRITREMKEDVARNIDNIIEHVERLRPAAESANYAQTILLYDEIVDDMQRLMESLEDTFTKIFEELNQIIDDL